MSIDEDVDGRTTASLMAHANVVGKDSDYKGSTPLAAHECS